ncbi:MAG TPA: hypothetical protein VMG10_31245 [Gemmataceae bacterium]|nr:hypothetical protein [Gemmataceae bacterium]
MFTSLLLLYPLALPSADPTVGASIGVVSRVKVLSDKVPDVSSLESWRKSFLKENMTDQEKALAVWRSTVMFQHQEIPPPCEYLTDEEAVQDPFKIFNVYGYSLCSVASCDIECLARYAGLRARGWGILHHSVPEVYWDGAWHLLDASLINYFPKKDGTIAGVEEIMAAIRDWHDKHPGHKDDDEAKLRAFQRADGWTAWKQGPELLARCPFYDSYGWLPSRTYGWCSTMEQYNGKADGSRAGKAFLFEYGYSQGYQVNIQLRRGERLTRNWFNRGLHINSKDGPKGGKAPGCLTGKTGVGPLAYTPQYGDLARGRIGNGTLEYDVPVQSSAYRSGALTAENLEESAVRVRDAAWPATLVLRMPCSYVYLAGTLTFTAAVGEGGSVAVSFSDNNGLDWKKIERTTVAGERRVDLGHLVFRRYDYRLKFFFRGRGTGLDTLKIVHDIQHSQRPLPALDQGDNSITFSAGPPEGTVTVEGATNMAAKGKQLLWTDFHPDVSGFRQGCWGGVDRWLFIDQSGKGVLTFPVATPGDLVRLRFGAHYRARDAKDGLDYHVSFDGGKTWQSAGRAAGPTRAHCTYVVFTDVPAGRRQALVRYTGISRDAASAKGDSTGIFNFRIDADYREPFGGFRPVRVTYMWEEDGHPKRDVHVARKPQETYTIRCVAKPIMKSIVLELAE